MLTIRNLSILHNIDLRPLIRNLSFTLSGTERLAVIGEEGNGKSALLKAIVHPESIQSWAAISGEIHTNGERIGYLAQEAPEEWNPIPACTLCMSSPAFIDADPAKNTQKFLRWQDGDGKTYKAFDANMAKKGGELTLTAKYGTNENIEAAEAVAQLIDALPEASAVKTSDADAINTAVKAYDDLTNAQKDALDPEKAKKLEAVRVALFNAYVAAIPAEVTDDSEAAIKAAQDVYDALPDDLKEQAAAGYIKLVEAKLSVAMDKLAKANIEITEKQKDIEDSKRVCDVLGIQKRTCNIGKIHQALKEVTDQLEVTANNGEFSVPFSQESDFNVGPRLRMTTLRYIAQALGARLVGTGNLSEATVGYCTKDGDTSCDFSLLGELTSVEVVEVGLTMEELPRELVQKTPADGLSGKSDEQRLGILYADMHRYIRFGTCGNEEVDEKIRKKELANMHKRRMPVKLDPFGKTDKETE